jgi:pimeloyl-ACP methyl ester carboxylesterase
MMATVTLADGSTEYELSGPASGPLVVLLHGGTVPMWTWDLQVPALNAAGYRTLRYDMYGKGKSAFPPVHYDRDLFKRQLSGLLEALGLTDPFDLVGFSFGGATAVNFTVSYPQKVKSLALIAPLFCYADRNALVRIARNRLVGALFVRFVVPKMGVARASRLWAGSTSTARYAQLVREQFQRAGFAPAFLSFMRSNALDDYSPVYRQLGEAGRQALLVWGTDDEDIPAGHIAQIRKLLPLADYHELSGVSHGAVFQAGEEINRLLRTHLVSTHAVSTPVAVSQ